MPVPVRAPDPELAAGILRDLGCHLVQGSLSCRILRCQAGHSGRDRSLLTRTRVILPSLVAMKSEASQGACTPMTWNPVRSAWCIASAIATTGGCPRVIWHPPEVPGVFVPSGLCGLHCSCVSLDQSCRSGPGIAESIRSS